MAAAVMLIYSVKAGSLRFQLISNSFRFRRDQTDGLFVYFLNLPVHCLSIFTSLTSCSVKGSRWFGSEPIFLFDIPVILLRLNNINKPCLTVSKASTKQLVSHPHNDLLFGVTTITIETNEFRIQGCKQLWVNSTSCQLVIMVISIMLWMQHRRNSLQYSTWSRCDLQVMKALAKISVLFETFKRYFPIIKLTESYHHTIIPKQPVSQKLFLLLHSLHINFVY